jgi:hypothetical protein
MRAALILRAPLLIRLRFAADPSGWRPRYHPLRFARIIRFAPRCAARDARTASRMPGPARRLEITDKVSIHAFRGEGDRFDHARTAPDAAQNAPSASQKPAPRARRSAGACRGARPDRRTSPHRRYAPALRARRRPERARSHQKPAARQKPGRRQPEARTARAPVRWRVSWRASRPAYQPATALRAALRARRRPERARPLVLQARTVERGIRGMRV